MTEAQVYRVLEHSWVYRWTQILLAPGAARRLTAEIRGIAEGAQSGGQILDVGCGPSSWLWRVGLRPTGLDISHAYGLAFAASGERAVTGSAAALPWQDASFDSVWSVGMLHHLTEDLARAAIMEMVRVCRRGGAVVVFDGVFPESGWRRPVPWVLRRVDRGRFMRSQQALEALLPVPDQWVRTRIDYSLIGHEGVFCMLRKA